MNPGLQGKCLLGRYLFCMWPVKCCLYEFHYILLYFVLHVMFLIQVPNSCIWFSYFKYYVTALLHVMHMVHMKQSIVSSYTGVTKIHFQVLRNLLLLLLTTSASNCLQHSSILGIVFLGPLYRRKLCFASVAVQPYSTSSRRTISGLVEHELEAPHAAHIRQDLVKSTT